uniref:Uncharacterized protein n=1 Tax=Anguilla anguilla TaxID=7936 RepID=A0A0E9STF7_ANGAN
MEFIGGNNFTVPLHRWGYPSYPHKYMPMVGGIAEVYIDEAIYFAAECTQCTSEYSGQSLLLNT